MSSGTAVSLCCFINHWNMCLTGLIITYVSASLCQLQLKIGENLNQFPCQPLPPPLLYSLLALKTWKLSPGQETSLQNPSKHQQMEGQMEKSK